MMYIYNTYMKFKNYIIQKKGANTLIHQATSHSPTDIPLNKPDVHFYGQKMKQLLFIR